MYVHPALRASIHNTLLPHTWSTLLGENHEGTPLCTAQGSAVRGHIKRTHVSKLVCKIGTNIRSVRYKCSPWTATIVIWPRERAVPAVRTPKWLRRYPGIRFLFSKWGEEIPAQHCAAEQQGIPAFLTPLSLIFTSLAILGGEKKRRDTIHKIKITVKEHSLMSFQRGHFAYLSPNWHSYVYANVYLFCNFRWCGESEVTTVPSRRASSPLYVLKMNFQWGNLNS